MDIESIKVKIRLEKYVYSQHADNERAADGLAFGQVEEALLSGSILE